MDWVNPCRPVDIKVLPTTHSDLSARLKIGTYQTTTYCGRCDLLFRHCVGGYSPSVASWRHSTDRAVLSRCQTVSRWRLTSSCSSRCRRNGRLAAFQEEAVRIHRGPTALTPTCDTHHGTSQDYSQHPVDVSAKLRRVFHMIEFKWLLS